jgi:hypothetical protein
LSTAETVNRQVCEAAACVNRRVCDAADSVNKRLCEAREACGDCWETAVEK